VSYCHADGLSLTRSEELQPGISTGGDRQCVRIGPRPTGGGKTQVLPDGRRAQILLDIASALGTELFFETFLELDADGTTSGHGPPSALSLAAPHALVRGRDMWLARPPAAWQRAGG
jgi:hypothetical protein